MILLRSLIYFVAMVFSILLFGLYIGIAGTWLSQHAADRVGVRWARLNLQLQRIICGLGYQIEGAENLPSGSAIVMAKHQSAWETIALRGLLRADQSWVLKQELMRIPLFGRGLALTKSIPIDRSAGRRAVIKVVREGTARLEEGRIVVIFPEGTRTAPGERRKYGVGGGVLAERSGVAVIPIAHNAGVFWRRRGVKKFPGTVQLVVGPPIPAAGRKAADIMRDVETWIETTQSRLPNSATETK